MDVCAVFVFDAEDGPHSPAADFGEGDEEAEEGGVLDVGGVDGVEDPVEAEDRVEEHSEVVDPYSPETEDVAEKGVFGVGVAETPVHCEIPDGAEDGVEAGACDEYSAELVRAVDSVEAEGHAIEDRHEVFAEVC